MSTFGKSRATGRRFAPRVAAPIHATLSSGLRNDAAELVEVSRTGARLAGKSLPTIGEQLTFRAGDVQALGEVVRSERHECAIEFQTPIATGEVDQLRKLGAPSNSSDVPAGNLMSAPLHVADGRNGPKATLFGVNP
jgi:hypothetical protein